MWKFKPYYMYDILYGYLRKQVELAVIVTGFAKGSYMCNYKCLEIQF